MNQVILIGRLTRDPEVRYSGETAIARYTLAVDRRFKRDGEPTADFINCTAFGKAGEFAEKYLNQGTKIAVTGRIQTGSYTNRDGQKVYTTDVVVEGHEFVESRQNTDNNQQTVANSAPTQQVSTQPIPNAYQNAYTAQTQPQNAQPRQTYNQPQQQPYQQNRQQQYAQQTFRSNGSDFINIPDGIDEQLPFV